MRRANLLVLLGLLFAFARAGGHASRRQKAIKLQCTSSASIQTITSEEAAHFL